MKRRMRVGIFHRTVLPGRTGIAEVARTDAVFQSPEAGELRATSKVKLWGAKAGKGENVPMILSMMGRECRLWSLIITV